MPSLPFHAFSPSLLWPAERPPKAKPIIHHLSSQRSMSSHHNMEEEKGREEKKVALLLEVKEDGEPKEVILVDLEMGNKGGGDGSTSVPPVLELNLIGSFGLVEADQSAVTVELSLESEPGMFSCKYCQMKFYSSKVLGGHQNVHKRERALAKCSTAHCHRGCIENPAAGVGGAPYHFLPSMASLPLHGSHSRRPLDIQMHSMVHKLYIGVTTTASMAAAGLLYGRHGGWSRPPLFVNCQPAMGRLFTEELYGATRARRRGSMSHQECRLMVSGGLAVAAVMPVSAAAAVVLMPVVPAVVICMLDKRSCPSLTCL